jgi:hypothetical protein
LERTHLELIQKFIENLEEDPALLVRIILKIIDIGPSKPSMDSRAREKFKSNASVLYLPEPYYKELADDVKDDIKNLLDLIKRGDLENALTDVKKKFKDKYSEGDLQAPGVEEVVEEALILVLATLRFKETINATTKKHVLYYYSLFTLERSFEIIPIALMTIISSMVPPESLPPALPEYLKKLRLYIDPSIMKELEARERELGFAYSDFKKAFLEVEQLFK